VDALIRTARAEDIPAIQRIYNREILEGVATWDIEPWSDAVRAAWLDEHLADPTLPVVVADLEGDVAGFAYFTTYRGKVGYRYTRETSVYVDPRYHRHGLGRALMASQIATARRVGLHALMAVIEASNEASIALHRELGFVEVARKREVGRKFGRWLDSVEMQLLLPLDPSD
jgi:phosphinothricin acetyltransferase